MEDWDDGEEVWDLDNELWWVVEFLIISNTALGNKRLSENVVAPEFVNVQATTP